MNRDIKYALRFDVERSERSTAWMDHDLKYALRFETPFDRVLVVYYKKEERGGVEIVSAAIHPRPDHPAHKRDWVERDIVMMENGKVTRHVGVIEHRSRLLDK